MQFCSFVNRYRSQKSMRKSMDSRYKNIIIELELVTIFKKGISMIQIYFKNGIEFCLKISNYIGITLK